MIKKLKTLEQVKSLYFKIQDEGDGICLYNNIRNAVFINEDMYPFFGNKIKAAYINKDIVYDYMQENYCWLYCEEWFDNDLFSDKDFMI